MSLTRRYFVGAALAGGIGLAPAASRTQSNPPPLPEGRPPLSPGAGGESIHQAGTRFTWFGGAASIPGERYQIEPDLNGGWVSRATGRRYSQFETPGPAGAGYLVSDFLGPTPAGLLSWSASYLLHPDVGGATSFMQADGAVSASQNLGDFWMPPSRLEAIGEGSLGGMKVLRAPYPYGGRTYRALLTQARNDDGWNQSTYDLDSGLLLSASSTAQGSSVLTLDPSHQIVPGAGSTMLTFSRLAGVRRTNLPGPGEVYPDEMRRLRLISYSGSRGIVMAGSDIQAPPATIEVRYDVTANAGSYLSTDMTVSAPIGMGGSQRRIFPAGVIGSLWMNPAYLGRHDTGELLDEDSNTGARTAILARQKDIIFIRLQTPLSQSTLGYDLHSGLLLRSELRQQVGPATDITSVQIAAAQ